MDRHVGWSVIVALIGGGQEINSGEIGLMGWHDAIRDRYPDWDVYYSDKLNQDGIRRRIVDVSDLIRCSLARTDPSSCNVDAIFSRRSTLGMIHHLIAGDTACASATHRSFSERFPIRITRDIDWPSLDSEPCSWSRYQGTDRFLRSDSAETARRVCEEPTFTRPTGFERPEDIRSCHFLEDVATEFDIQGLELDWGLVAWDADYRFRRWPVRALEL